MLNGKHILSIPILRQAILIHLRFLTECFNIHHPLLRFPVAVPNRRFPTGGTFSSFFAFSGKISSRQNKDAKVLKVIVNVVEIPWGLDIFRSRFNSLQPRCCLTCEISFMTRILLDTPPKTNYEHGTPKMEVWKMIVPFLTGDLQVPC